MSETINCFNCDSEISKTFGFCPDCGSKIKCKKCESLLVKGANFCIECGTSVLEENTISETNLNKIKFRETKDEREYEVTFTDKVASDVKNVVANMFSSKTIGMTQPTTDLNIGFTRTTENAENAEVTEDSEEVIIKQEKSNVEFEFPHPNDLKMDLENLSEKDWILIFAFYMSDFGKKTFNKKSVTEKYKIERKTDSRINNFNRTWESSFKDYFRTVNDEELKINEKGVDYARKVLLKEIIIKSPIPKPKANGKNKMTSTNTGQKPKTSSSKIKMEEFEISEGIGLQGIFQKANPNATKENILCIGYYINFILKREYFTDGNIDFALRALKLPRPNTLRQIITNIKNNEVWIEKVEEKFWKLNRIGELHCEKMMNDGN